VISAPSTSTTPGALRRRILTEASAIVVAQGVDALTVRLVASRSGCSTIGVYTHFGDKAGLVEAVLLDAWDGFDAALSTADDTAGPAGAPAVGTPAVETAAVETSALGTTAVDRLVRAGHAYRDWALAHRTLYVVMFTPVVPGMVERPAVQERGAGSLAAHRARVDAALADGSLRADDPDALATAVWSLAHGWVMAELLGALPLTPSAGPDAAPAAGTGPVVRAQFETSVRALLAGFRP
jgi:AcrR family transcriptional regulator